MRAQPGLSLVLCVLLFSCSNDGGSSAQLGAAAPAAAPPVQIQAALPGLPADSYTHPLRATAQADAVLPGSEAEDLSGGVQLTASTAQLTAAESGLEWAIYRFSGTPQEVITAVGCTAAGLAAGEGLYLAVSDYQLGSWNFMPVQTVTSASHALGATAGRWQSPLGNTFVAVVGFDAVSFDIENVQLQYRDRFSVNGSVVDGDGQPVEGVMVTSFFGGLSALSDANGNFNLSGLPDGNWPIAAARNGWTFYDQPALAQIDGADTVVELVGDPGRSRFTNREALPNNDLNPGPVWDFAAAPLLDSVSRLDDIEDHYSFTVTEPGNYYFYFTPIGESMLFPLLELRTISRSIIAQSAPVVRGAHAVGFSVFEAPLECSIEITCGSASGGEYSLSLEQGNTVALGGEILVTSGELNGTLVEATHNGLGHATEYMPNFSAGDITYLDMTRVPGSTTVMPFAPGYTFVPESQTLTLSGEQLDFDFDAQLGDIQDAFEPNNSLVAATMLSLPYLETDALSVGGLDQSDYYRFTLPVGEALAITVIQQPGAGDLGSLSLTLMDADGLGLSGLIRFGEVFFLDRHYLGAGADYHLLVQAGTEYQVVPYSLRIETFAPATLQLGVRVDGVELPAGARFIVHNEDFTERLSYSSSSAVLTGPRYFVPGSTVHVECLRHGMPVHRQTRRVTLAAGDNFVFFDSPDWGIDNYEPNHLVGMSGISLTQPYVIEATISNISDDRDAYNLVGVPDEMLGVTLVTSPPGCEIDIEITSTLDEEEIFDDEIADGESLRFWPLHYEQLDIHINAQSDDFSYTLTVEPAEGHTISGEVRRASPDAPLPDAVMYLIEDDEKIGVDGAGEYHTDYLAPGIYHLACLAVGYDPPYTERTVVIDDEDVQENFLGLVQSSSDNYEPNDDSFTAEPIQLDSFYEASAGDPNSGDVFDYYQISGLTAGQQLHCEIVTEAPHNLFGALYRTDDLRAGAFYELDPGTLILDAVVGADLDHYVVVSGYGDYVLHVTEAE